MAPLTPAQSGPPQHPGPFAHPAPGPTAPAARPALGPTPPALGPTPPGTGRRPGWGGVIGVGVGAAVLASALTAGGITLAGSSGDRSAPPASAGPPAASQPPPLVTSAGSLPDWVAVAHAVEPSVVSIKITVGRSGGQGSGMILDKQGHILTNHHVVSTAQTTPSAAMTVSLSDGRTYDAKIDGVDPSTDLAVIQITNPPADLRPATLGDSSAVRIGDPVMALGNPLGYSDTATTGIVSAVGRPIAVEGEQTDPNRSAEPVVTNAIQTDAAINHGNSGGALIDAGGRIVGVTFIMVSPQDTGNIGIGFAIPMNEARLIADSLVRTGSFQHAYLGVAMGDALVPVDGTKRRGAVIGTVEPGTPAARAGLQAGDAVVAVNGAWIPGRDSLVGTIRSVKPGTPVTLTVVRGGVRRDVKVTLVARPASGG